MDAEKKSLTATERNDRLRAIWRDETPDPVPGELLFLDETIAHTAFIRLRARAPRGHRAPGTVPRNHGPNVTLLAVLGPTGIATAIAIPGATTRAVFDACTEQFLTPLLRPGQTVILDNLTGHKSATARARIKAAGGQLRSCPLFPRLQSDRADLRQDQDVFAGPRRARSRRPAGRHLGGARCRHRRRCRRPLRRLRLSPAVAS